MSRDPDHALAPSGLSLSAWVASLVADEAARSRSRTAWLARQAAEEGTFAGVLLDLAERRARVVVHLHNGRRHRGTLTLVGRDFCGLRSGTGRDVLVADRGLASVRTLPDDAITVGDRPARTDLTLAEALAALAEHRTRAMIIGHDPDDAVAGELRSVGADLVTVRLDGGGGTAYVATAAVLELTLAGER
jgi:hypothetical protein